jgi:type VI secretion system protein
VLRKGWGLNPQPLPLCHAQPRSKEFSVRREQSLLDRIDNEPQATTYTTQFNWNGFLESIIQNVQNMLNVRMGSVMALPEFGMPDFNDVVNQFPDAIQYIRNAIQHFIEEYEPRIESVNVYYVPDPDQPLHMKYSIEGRIRYQNEVSNVMFDTVLTGSGQATVRV